MKGNKAVGDTHLLCVSTHLPGTSWGLLTALSRMGLQLRGRKIQVRFKWDSRTGRTDEGRGQGQQERIGKCFPEIDTHLLLKSVGVVLQ